MAVAEGGCRQQVVFIIQGSPVVWLAFWEAQVRCPDSGEQLWKDQRVREEVWARGQAQDLKWREMCVRRAALGDECGGEGRDGKESGRSPSLTWMGEAHFQGHWELWPGGRCSFGFCFWE